MLYALLYVNGFSLSHRAAYKTLKNLRSSLQEKLERQPLGTIQEKGVGTLKKMFIDDIDSIELLLAHALPEGLSNVAVPAFVFLAMFFVDWKLALLSLCAQMCIRDSLYIAYYLKQNRIEYYDRMSEVRNKENYEQWVKFFLRAIARPPRISAYPSAPLQAPSGG